MLNFKLVKNLKQFGLTEYEAKAYLTLSIRGPLQASSITEFAKIPQSKVYEIMRSLTSKSLIEKWSSKPQKFRAIEPVYALKKIIHERNSKIEELKKRSNSIINELKPLMENKVDSGLWASKGKKAFLEKAIEILERTKNFGCASTSRFSRHPYLDQAFLKAIKRGVQIRMLGTSDLDESSRLRAEWYLNNGADVKIIPMDIRPIIGIADNKEVSIRIDNGIDSDFIWSNNPALINIMKCYFDNLWKDAKEFRIK